MYKFHAYNTIRSRHLTELSNMMLTASDGDGRRKKNIFVAVFVGSSALLLLGMGGFFVWNKFFRNRGDSLNFPFSHRRNTALCKSLCLTYKFALSNPGTSQTQRFNSFDSSVPLTPVQERNMEGESSRSKDLNVTLFDVGTIVFSTNNFATSAKLGEGGFGSVYKVTIVENVAAVYV
jgi:hypothetical protein